MGAQEYTVGLSAQVYAQSLLPEIPGVLEKGLPGSILWFLQVCTTPTECRDLLLQEDNILSCWAINKLLVWRKHYLFPSYMFISQTCLKDSSAEVSYESLAHATHWNVKGTWRILSPFSVCSRQALRLWWEGCCRFRFICGGTASLSHSRNTVHLPIHLTDISTILWSSSQRQDLIL